MPPNAKPALIDRAASSASHQLPPAGVVEMCCDVPISSITAEGVLRTVGAADVAMGEDGGQSRYGATRKRGVRATR